MEYQKIEGTCADCEIKHGSELCKHTYMATDGCKGVAFLECYKICTKCKTLIILPRSRCSHDCVDTVTCPRCNFRYMLQPNIHLSLRNRKADKGETE